MSARVYVLPDDEQLARFVAVSALGSGYTASELGTTKAMLDGFPKVRAGWLDRHRQMQEAAWRLDDEPPVSVAPGADQQETT